MSAADAESGSGGGAPAEPLVSPWDRAPQTASRYAPATVEHFQHPRNVGRLEDADAMGRVDDPETDTLVTLYVKLGGDRIARATFRTFGCSACIAASSMATELLVGQTAEEARLLSAEALDSALGGLPSDKRYCADLVARAIQHALSSLRARA